MVVTLFITSTIGDGFVYLEDVDPRRVAIRAIHRRLSDGPPPAGGPTEHVRESRDAY